MWDGQIFQPLPLRICQLLLPRQLQPCMAWPAIHRLAGLAVTILPTLVLQPQPCLESSAPSCVSPSLLQVDECVFFNSLVVGLPYSLILCQFWLFSVFKLLLSFFWLCEEAQCLYLCLHLGRKLVAFFKSVFQ